MIKQFFFIIFCLLCFVAFAQEQDTSNEYNADSVFIIDSIDVIIEGITKQYAVINAGEFKEGEEINGESALTQYINDKTQLLYNKRLWEVINIEYTAGQVRDDGKYPLALTVNLKDSHNLLYYPYPKYSSNFGFSMTVNALHANFFGTMSQVNLSVGYRHDEMGQNNYLLSLDSVIPFRAFNHNWNLYSENDFEYRPYFIKPFYYLNTTGLYIDIPLGNMTLIPGISGSVLLNKEFSDYSDTYSELSFGPSIELSNINWIGNFRKGFSFSVLQSHSYNFYNKEHDHDPWGMTHTLSAINHFIIIDDIFGISGRLIFRHAAKQAVFAKAGDVLRGVMDIDLKANYLLAFNIDFPFRLFMFKPSEWFNKNKLKIFDFELQLSPGFDIVYYNDPSFDADTGFGEKMLYTGAIDAIIYPDYFRNFSFRISFGKNLKRSFKTESYELYIGGEFFY